MVRVAIVSPIVRTQVSKQTDVKLLINYVLKLDIDILDFAIKLEIDYKNRQEAFGERRHLHVCDL